MKIEGEFNPSHILRTFLAHEYAFEILYPNKLVRISHWKGTWYAWKSVKNSLTDYFEFNDCGGGIVADDEMTHGLIEKIEKINFEKEKETSREHDAWVLDDVLNIWAGPSAKIMTINVVQPGRNGMINKATGDFELAPRYDES